MKLYVYEDLCICCGEPVPEGSFICKSCEMKAENMDSKPHDGSDARKRSAEEKTKPRRLTGRLTDIIMSHINHMSSRTSAQ